MANTKKPSGLKISRKGLAFTFTWKIADSDYGDGQKVGWRIYTGKWSGWTFFGGIGAKTTSASKSFSAASYWPNTKTYLYGIQFCVRGKRKATTKDNVTTNYSWSDYAYCTFDLVAPNAPSASQAWESQEVNVSTFSWSVKTSDTDTKPFYNCEWQSILVKECKQTDGSKLSWKTSTLGWQTGTGGASGSKPIPEDPLLLAQNSYTRWFRVRARGCGGNGAVKGCSYWKYTKHVYAIPYVPVINKTAKEGNLNWVRVNWTADQNAAHPIDIVMVDWAIGTPRAGRALPTNPSWTTALTFRDTGGKDEANFLVDQALDFDECMWVRIGVQHDRNWRESGGRLVSSGKLTAPSGLNVEVNTATRRAVVTATNESAVPDSKMAIVFRDTGKQDIVIGVIAAGSSSAMVVFPAHDDATSALFGVYAFQGSHVGQTGKDGVTTYSITANMTSATVWGGGYVPKEPSNVSAETTDRPGEVLIKWGWGEWTKANRAEISWSQNPNAWESTDEPDTYMITNLNTARWRVSGLEQGVTWYFRVRLAQVVEDEYTYGPYCDVVAVDLSSAPSVPVLTLSQSVIPFGGKFTASWVYTTTDGTPQIYAEVRRATVAGEVVTPGDLLPNAKVSNASQRINITAPSDWTTGGQYFAVVRVKSASGHISEYSAPVPIAVADPVTCTIDQTSLQEVTLTEGEETRTVMALTAMPLTATITGAGAGGQTTLIIERAAEYHMDRPDESQSDGYEGETIVLIRQTGEAQITVDLGDLVGVLDDGAPYRLIATTQDGLGQSATEELDFEVHWTHQAEVPEATVRMEDGASVITVAAPEGAAQGDVCDIYRLSADSPELIVEGGAFGTAYVDPYPTIGTGYGHRCVHRTVNGDYITADNQPAWIDLDDTDGDLLEEYSIIVDFDGRQLILPYDIGLVSRWEKDFEKTDYLGGSQQGDWNPAVTRTATYTCNLIADDDAETIRGLRALAAFAGICHIRTPEGSSYAANIEVTESKEYTNWDVVAYTLTVTRVDAERLDGIPYSEWVEA